MTEDGVVTLKDGKIKGIKEKSPFFNAEFYSFYGVPYGQPAIGDLRFRVSSFPLVNFHNYIITFCNRAGSGESKTMEMHP